MKILYEDNHIFVVLKQPNILVQGDATGDDTLENVLKEYSKIKYHKPGNVYLGVVHRLDRMVGGVMVFARTSKAAARLSEQIRTHRFEKEYHAVVMGHFSERSGTMQDLLWKDERKNLVSVDPRGKESILHYEVLDEKEGLSFVKIHLKTGRSHQIRVQFASRGHALYGDHKYNRKDCGKGTICLFCNLLSFYHPITGEKMTFRYALPEKYPWSLFKG